MTIDAKLPFRYTAISNSIAFPEMMMTFVFRSYWNNTHTAKET